MHFEVHRHILFLIIRKIILKKEKSFTKRTKSTEAALLLGTLWTLFQRKIEINVFSFLPKLVQIILEEFFFLPIYVGHSTQFGSNRKS